MYFFKIFIATVYFALQLVEKDLRKKTIALSFLYYRKSILLKIHNILANLQILRHDS